MFPALDGINLQDMYFNTGQNKDNLTVKKTVERATEPKDKAFWSFFFKTRKTTRVIGFASQILSGITEATAVYFLAGGTRAAQWSNLTAFLLAAFIVYLFEYIGIRVYLVKVVRQRQNKDINQKKQGKKLGTFNMVFLAIILLLNIGTSVLSLFTGFEDAKSNDKYSKELSQIDTEEMTRKQAIRDKYYKISEGIAANTTEEKQSIEKSYSETLKRLESAAVNAWDSPQQRKKIAGKIATIAEEKAQEIKAAEGKSQMKTEKLEDEKAEELKAVTEWATRERNAINKKGNTNAFILAIFQKFSIAFLIIFILIGVAAIWYEELFFSGSEVEFTTDEASVKPNLLQVLAIGIYQRFIYHPLYVLVSWVVGSKSYDYTRILQEKKTFSSIEAIGKMPQISSNIPSFKTAKNKSMQIQPVAVQQQEGNIDAQRYAVLERYNINTVASWYKRAKSSKKKTTRESNLQKYQAAKADLQSVNVKFIERKNNVTIKL